MAREYAQIVTSIWSDPDWRSLTPEAQRMFLVLLSQPKLTMVGVIDYMPDRWAAHAAGLTVDDVKAALAELEDGDKPWVFIDIDHGELLIRSFVKNDGSARNQKLRAAMWGAWGTIESPWLRREVLDHLPAEAWVEEGKGAAPPAAIQLREAPSQRPGKALPNHRNRPWEAPHPHPHPHPQPQPNTPSSAAADGATDTFDEWWSAYPKKVGKKAARRAYLRALKDTGADVLLTAMTARADLWRRDGTARQFIPDPATWLNQGRWDDELDQPAPVTELRPDAMLVRNQRRQSGEACPECADAGLILDGDGLAWPCLTCQREDAG